MSNVIEYEYVTGGRLKGGQPASKGGILPTLKETLLTENLAMCIPRVHNKREKRVLNAPMLCVECMKRVTCLEC